MGLPTTTAWPWVCAVEHSKGEIRMRRKKIGEEEKKGRRKRRRQRKGEEEEEVGKKKKRKGEEEKRLCGIGRRKNEWGDKMLGF